MMIKAVSLLQPWASLIAAGAKKFETRSWSTTYRGPLLICASRPLGVAVAVAWLSDCRLMQSTDWGEGAACCEPYPRAWAWVLTDICAIEPFPVSGRLSLFHPPLPDQIPPRLKDWLARHTRSSR